MKQKGFIAIPLIIAIMASIVAVSAVTIGVVLHKKGKLAPLVASVSQVFRATKDTEPEVKSEEPQPEQGELQDDQESQLETELIEEVVQQEMSGDEIVQQEQKSAEKTKPESEIMPIEEGTVEPEFIPEVEESEITTEIEEEASQIEQESQPEPEYESESEIETDLCVGVNCSDCQYCDLGSCINYCQNTDNSCGCTNCVNCNDSDGCSGDSYLDYYCSDISCTYTSDNCSDCSCSCGGYNTEESIANGNCSDGKDNDCDGFIDSEDSDCVPEGTEITGNITSNSKWMVANSPYIIIDTVQVFENVTLEIEPGVIVKFNKDARFIIEGRLVAIGTKNQNIIFTSNQISPNSGDWEEILFLKTSNESVIKNCIIEYATYGINIHSSPLISDNVIRYSQLWGIVADDGSPDIINNLITDNSTGVRIGDKAKLVNNTIANNRTTGVTIRWGSPTVSKNIIKGNDSYGITAQTPDAIIHYNNIYGNRNVNFRLTIPDDIDISNNYWGTLDSLSIDSKIEDYYDSVTLGKANYRPIATSEIPDAGAH